MTLKDDLSHEKFMREQFEQSIHNLLARAAALEDTLQKQLAIRDDLVIRVNELEAERDELRAILDEIKENTIMPDGTRLSEAVEQVMKERDEARAKLEQAQRRIEELETTLKDISTAPYENQPNDGDEWEKEYYLRGMHRP